VLGDGALEYHREHGSTERAADLLSRPGDVLASAIAAWSSQM
jgi:hypothetical protein